MTLGERCWICWRSLGHWERSIDADPTSVKVLQASFIIEQLLLMQIDAETLTDAQFLCLHYNFLQLLVSDPAVTFDSYSREQTSVLFSLNQSSLWGQTHSILKISNLSSPSTMMSPIRGWRRNKKVKGEWFFRENFKQLKKMINKTVGFEEETQFVHFVLCWILTWSDNENCVNMSEWTN